MDQKRAIGKVWLKIVWQTGAASEHWYNRRVRSYDEYALSKRIHQRIRELHGQGKLDDEIATELTAEGLYGAKGCVFTNGTIWLLRHKMGLPAVIPSGSPLPAQWEDGAYSVQGAAEAVGVYPGTIHKWLRTGRIRGKQKSERQRLGRSFSVHGRSRNSATTFNERGAQRKRYHERFGEPTIAEAICDRIVHGAHRIELKGESVRKLYTQRKAEAKGRLV